VYRGEYCRREVLLGVGAPLRFLLDGVAGFH
jgi:hypothetical protein